MLRPEWGQQQGSMPALEPPLLSGVLLSLVPIRARRSGSLTASTRGDLPDASLVGTMLTVQTSIGFLLTIVSIHLLPSVVAAAGWTGALTMLAIGPFLGAWAMWRLRQHPDGLRMAGGRRCDLSRDGRGRSVS